MQSIMTDDATMSRGQKNHAPLRGRQRTRFGASGTLGGAGAPPSRTFLPKRALRRSQLAAIYESMT